ncbi:MAG: hypothetical protein JETT_0996 [Candidatus Jettenia ecosi]|uniref:Uncharacterized protein n=1 Tax=Candidatus Jettenia ecosi TaxID=2494326 RepID=A0A533QD24_9BACT|nr:MAG: hypothetical protein JETT_0996 [Candidatus Jettenia ecosi]
MQKELAWYGGDGAYDKRKVYDSCIRREIPTIRIPPGRNVKI